MASIFNPPNGNHQGGFGPTFWLELTNAGVWPLAETGMVLWTQDGNYWFDASLTPQQIATIQGVINAHDPTKQMAKPIDPIAVLQQQVAALQTQVTALQLAATLTTNAQAQP